MLMEMKLVKRGQHIDSMWTDKGTVAPLTVINWTKIEDSMKHNVLKIVS